ncbi:MAG: hypothetical protein EAZ09_22445 [Oscillatoriales cyanobacterium]|nr:MAG: hypothetical protein EAZ18_11270 [Oscillatoriales cyanobacterium]TAH16122.1 MAG: hypothetical protein EAZ09_22445 [Oscillatoriales cyanobacterium]
MITPCNQPLKKNPFTTYRDPVTGRWTVVVETVLTTSETDSNTNEKTESKNESKITKIPTASSAICITKQNISFSLSLVKYQRKKSAVNLTLIPNRHLP